VTAPSTILTTVASALATRYPDFAVEAHGGQFTERELPMLLGRAPAILVACAGVSRLEPSGEFGWRADWRWSVAILAADLPAVPGDPPDVPSEPARPRAGLALDTAFDLLTWLPDRTWGLAGARLPDPTSFGTDNLYTGHVNNLRIALWGVTWTQSFLFAPE
jgi:hypothetical protein